MDVKMMIIMIIIIFWFGDTVTILHLTEEARIGQARPFELPPDHEPCDNLQDSGEARIGQIAAPHTFVAEFQSFPVSLPTWPFYRDSSLEDRKRSERRGGVGFLQHPHLPRYLHCLSTPSISIDSSGGWNRTSVLSARHPPGSDHT